MAKKAIDRTGISKQKESSIPTGDSNFKSIRNGVFCSELVEPIPAFVTANCEKIYPGKNNNYIVMGRDRNASRNSGYGGKGDTQASMIDIVVGRMAESPKDDVYVDPDFEVDAARIYISQKSDIDSYFGLAKGSGNSVTRSAIAVKADAVRLISRENIKIVSGIDSKNSQGGNIESAKYGVDIIANNLDSDLQPMVKGNNLVEAMMRLTHHVQKLNAIVDGLLVSQSKLNQEVKDHWHVVNPKFGRTFPSIPVQAVGQIVNWRLMGKTKTSLRANRVNLKNFEKNYLTQSGRGYINSRYNKVN